MIPKIKGSHRSAINSFAAAFARKLKCGFHSGNDASSHKPMRVPPLQIIDVNLQIAPPALIVKRSRAEFRRPHGGPCASSSLRLWFLSIYSVAEIGSGLAGLAYPRNV